MENISCIFAPQIKIFSKNIYLIENDILPKFKESILFLCKLLLGFQIIKI